VSDGFDNSAWKKGSNVLESVYQCGEEAKTKLQREEEGEADGLSTPLQKE
ncbi:hypothetical protein M9458_021446, partial [Cirrhinus mrigala]